MVCFWLGDIHLFGLVGGSCVRFLSSLLPIVIDVEVVIVVPLLGSFLLRSDFESILLTFL